MSMDKRRSGGRQRLMWMASADLPRSAGHPCYERLNRVLDEAGFDAFAEEQCAKFYADAWRAGGSLSLRQFLDVALEEAPPDHSTVSWMRSATGC
jgi:hypothetical protein